MATPTLVLVTGPAGSGKTTLAHALATAIGCPALCRDEIKEGMVAAAPGFVPSPTDPLTLRTYDLFFTLVETYAAAEVTLVAEAAFQHRLWRQGLDRVRSPVALRLVRCLVDDAVAVRRQQDRTAAQPTRAAHADAAHLAAAAPFEPLRLDAPTLEVRTDDGWTPGLAAVAEFCRA